MNLLSRYTKTILILSLLFSANEFYAQQGSITINQAPELETLLALKKEMNGSDSDSNRYKIQIFSGDRTGAEKAKSNFEAKFEKIPSLLVYETPNYKVWAGNFRSRLEADRALEKIKKEFNDAFRFKPKKKDKK
ncbi:Sporulation related domain-containing protein [Bizionia echini]|uniref:Sporulation related domain-containing protein n=1 Tax=Bizionia echini TaxID=649333 RepID=A0A1I4ZRU5_9FLAO|nr:SPOR domain-containing protein [Bizionia echini]SFN52971.1 Sporulation related domain-containing protein [Bizionia echini]|tara:strand:+ start:719 stop:1120 length:402 start_codon:yes stop_codon:yes gene_type:complete